MFGTNIKTIAVQLLDAANKVNKTNLHIKDLEKLNISCDLKTEKITVIYTMNDNNEYKLNL